MNDELKALTQFRLWDLCLLCGDQPELIGFFKPDHGEEWGAPEGKTRYFRYCLCKECFHSSNAQDRVEKVIEADLKYGGGYVC
jgi:hypothetical protein